MMINEILVGFVDERCEEEDGSRDERKAPEGDDLDEIVGEESTKEGLRFVSACLSWCWKIVELTAPDAKTFSAKTIR
jgi:hypothetical protein